jgi:hypothetical protein
VQEPNTTRMPRTSSPFRRLGIALAACAVVAAVSMTAYVEATVLAHVASPEAAAADAVACRVPPPKAKNA